MKIYSLLFEEVDNGSLVLFRIFFGLLLMLESWGAIATGWVHETFILTDFTFSFIGFEWLQPLPGNGMYFYYIFMGILGIAVMLGYRYRIAMGGFTILWTLSYLMQKSHYNNHYYLLILLCALMVIVPAHQYWSLDVKRNPELKKLTCPRWCYLVFILQLWIVYTYAGVVKFYPGWLNGDFISLLFGSRSHFPIVGPLLQEKWVQDMVIYGGIFFDLLIIPMLLWKRTRYLGLIFSAFFHLFNSFVLHIGIFPYLMLAMDIFFFPPEKIRATFLKRKPEAPKIPWKPPALTYQKILTYSFVIFFLIQIALPLRPYIFEGNAFWTEEGHRMSWRMMLRSKNGSVFYKIVKENGEEETISPSKRLPRHQRRSMATKPDMIWQYAQRLRKEYADKGESVKIYALANVSLNGGKSRPLIDPEVDLASTPWEPFKHKEWIYSYPFE